MAKCNWEQKQRHNITTILKWYIIKSVPSYPNTTKICMLCLHGKFEILTYPNQYELLNKRSELVSKCRHIINLISIYCSTIKLMSDIPFNAFRIIA